MAKPTITRDPEIEALEKQLLPAVQEDNMGVSVLLDELPEFMKKYARGRGMEQIPAEDMARPRLKLTQKMSPHLGEAGTRIGDWFLPNNQENLGPVLKFVPVFCDTYGLIKDPSNPQQILARTKWVEDENGVKVKQVWDPSDTKLQVTLPGGSQQVWDTSSSVARSKLLTWGSREKGNPKGMAGHKFLRVFAWLLDFPKLSPVEVSFGGSSFKVGAQMMSQLKQSSAPVFGNRYVLSSREVHEPGRSYLVYVAEPDGIVKDEAFVAKLAEVEEGLRQMRLDVIIDTDDLDEPEIVPNGHEDAGVTY